jgi:hypothetical protein
LGKKFIKFFFFFFAFDNSADISLRIDRQPEATLPIHPTLGQDWDTAATAIDWPRLRAFLRTVKRIARIPEDHSSHDHLNEQKHVPLDEVVAARCKAEITKAQEEIEAASGTRVVWGLVDGFLLYWDQVEHICLPPISSPLASFSDSELTMAFFDYYYFS